MSQADIASWVAGMGETDRDRLLAIRNLLRHANEDRMSGPDRIICHQAMRALEDRRPAGIRA